MGRGIRFTSALLLLTLAAFGCGSDPEPVETVRVDEAGSGGEAPEARPDAVQIEGLMGTISADMVERGIEPRMGRFLRCFQERYGSLEVLGGRFEMAFRIHTDGSVRWVYPSDSTIGDRETERCLLHVASGIRFHRPRGGEAEFSYPLSLDTAEDVRPPLNWDEARVSDALIEDGPRLLSSCRPAGSRAAYHITAYIMPGGRVQAAGAATDDADAVDSLDCVAQAVRGWSMPDPGSYPAKVHFELR
ncbi:MAG: AgmX/PglI C-terminal domain-containing protein [Deltaproteobacteria bacterium]|nr:AgmX/PglI C-terminal domain-containing protein [Deltaproteobacteria bacterium]